MTLTEYKRHPLGIGDAVKTYDNGKDGHLTVWGKVTEVGDESFVVQWEDLKEDTEYEWQKVSINGEEIIDPKTPKTV